MGMPPKGFQYKANMKMYGKIKTNFKEEVFQIH
jgi:hypothetical protein